MTALALFGRWVLLLAALKEQPPAVAVLAIIAAVALEYIVRWRGPLWG